MKICIVGGIFGMSKEHQGKRPLTPETILANNLKNRGFEVHTVAHAAFRPSNSYDIIHVHHLGKAAIRMAAADISTPYIFTSHNPRILCNYKESIVRKMAFRYVLKRADAVIALTQIEANFLRKLANGQKFHVVPNGLPSDIFYCEANRHGQPKKSYHLLFVGQLVEFKGVNILLEAFQQVLRKWEATLLLVYQDSDLESRYQQMAKDLGIADHVQFLGFLSNFELAALYRENTDVLVHPSFAEALPTVVTEAMFSGIPVVATRVGGTPEQLDRFGKLVQPGNVAELAAAIDNVLAELPRYRELAQEANEYAKHKFNVKNMIDAHIRLYKELLECPKKKPSFRALDIVIRLAARIYFR
jgi:glycosyltransferase involved in cell wall biosynthesis